MASGVSGIAQTIAQGGFQMGQALGKGYSDLASGFSGMMQSRADRQRREEVEKEAQELLKQYAQDPNKLQELSDQYATQGNDPLSRLFAQAAERATQKETAGKQRGAQGGLVYITQAAARGVPIEQLKDGINSIISQGGTEEQIMSAYKRGVEMKTASSGKMTQVPAGSALVRETPEGGVEEVYRAPFKPTEPKKADIKYMERKDGSIMVLSEGNVLQTIPPPEKVGNQSSAMNVITKSVFMQSEIAKLADVDDFWEAGVVGKALSTVWAGSDAYDRDRDIMNIKANLGFEQINEMKRLAQESGASGTGLGQISNIEFMSLQSTIDSLDVGMSAEAQIEALQNIDRHLKVIQKLASGVAMQDAIEWGRPEYKVAGYHKDQKTGKVFYAPDGKDGDVYELVNGSFTKIRG